MYKMLNGQSKFSKSEHRMARHEFINGTTYYTEAQVKENNSGKGNPMFDLLPIPIDKKKLEEALLTFEVGNQGDTVAVLAPTTPP